jgi:hypothetical protein
VRNLVAQGILAKILQKAKEKKKFKVGSTHARTRTDRYLPFSEGHSHHSRTSGIFWSSELDHDFHNSVRILFRLFGASSEPLTPNASRAAQWRTINRGGHSIYEGIKAAGFEPFVHPLKVKV